MHESEEDRIRRIVDDELRKLGLDPDDPEGTREVLRWTKHHMETFDSLGSWTARSIVLAVVGGLVLAAWEGLKILVARVGK